MEKDLALQLLDLWISNKKVPDILSKEWPDVENPVIRFEWFSGKTKDIGYSSERYKSLWEKFNGYWNSKKEPQK